MRLLSPRERPIEPRADRYAQLLQPGRDRARRAVRAASARARAGASARSRLGALAAARHAGRRGWLSAAVGGPSLGGAATARRAGRRRCRFPPLPLRAIARKRGIAVGLVTQSWRGWAADLLKGAAIEAVLAGGRGRARRWRSRSRYPRGWWLPAAAGSVVFGAGAGGAGARSCSIRCSTTSRRCPRARRAPTCSSWPRAAGVKVGEVYSVDASRRTTAANAYVTGLGPTKRVVLFDTLLDRYSRDEVRVVVAHELAHVRNRDVIAGRGVRGAGGAGRRARRPAAQLGAARRARNAGRAAGAGAWPPRRRARRPG